MPTTYTEALSAQRRHHVPDRTLTQRLGALQRANEIRSRRAVLKTDLKEGREQVIDLLADSPEWLKTMKVFDVLLAVPQIGRVKANKILQTCRMSPTKTVGGMSQRQHRELILMLGYR